MCSTFYFLTMKFRHRFNRNLWIILHSRGCLPFLRADYHWKFIIITVFKTKLVMGLPDVELNFFLILEANAMNLPLTETSYKWTLASCSHFCKVPSAAFHKCIWFSLRQTFFWLLWCLLTSNHFPTVRICH